ncbi:hypothetical protein Y032_0242g3438 [Ancylostoma ceylanicum]|nr:hypothetical protein Y032_0242g3438 [Ancylostoma ceylanicum]
MLLEKFFSCRVGNITEMPALFDWDRIVDNEHSYGGMKNRVQLPRNFCTHLILYYRPYADPFPKNGFRSSIFHVYRWMSVSRRFTMLIAQTRKRDRTLLLNWLLHIPQQTGTNPATEDAFRDHTGTFQVDCRNQRIEEVRNMLITRKRYQVALCL